MIKLLIFSLLLLLLAVYITILAKHDPGYVLISYSDWSVEMTLVLLIIVSVTLIVSLIVLFYFLYKVLDIPGKLLHWNRQRKANKANKQATTGMIQLAEGKWRDAEYSLSKGATHCGAPLLNYIAAARAAQQQNKQSQRDHYLAEAFKHYPEAQIAIGLTQAELEIDADQKDQALVTLKHLYSIDPMHSQVLKMLVELYQQLNLWDKVGQLLTDIEHKRIYNPNDYHKLELAYYKNSLKKSVNNADKSELEAIWNKMHRKLQNDADMICFYASQLIKLGQHQQASDVIKPLLMDEWSSQAIEIFGTIVEDDPVAQLNFAENLLEKYKSEPSLLYALGQICLSNQLWGKARDYIQESIDIKADPFKWHVLGNLYEVRLNDPEKSMACYREGLNMCQPELKSSLDKKLALDNLDL